MSDSQPPYGTRLESTLAAMAVGLLTVLVLYVMSAAPFTALSYAVPALDNSVTETLYRPAREMCRWGPSYQPLRCWANCWGVSTRCNMNLKNIGPALRSCHEPYHVYIPVAEQTDEREPE